MKVSKGYVNIFKDIEANIISNIIAFGGVQGQVISRSEADACPDNVEGTFLVMGEEGYREEDSHLAAAIVRVRCVYNARKIWHVREDGTRRLVLAS